MKCKNCGNEIKDGEKFCKNCGADVNTNSDNSDNSANTEKTNKAEKVSKNLKSLGEGMEGCGCALILLPICALLIYFIYAVITS